MTAQIAYTKAWHELYRNTYAYLQPNGSWGLSNSGLVVSSGAALLVDTLFTLDLTRHMLDSLHALRPEVHIDGLALTHANGDHCWGAQLLPGVAVYASAATAQGIAEEIPPAAMTAMLQQSPPESAVGAYMRRFFAGFDFSGITLPIPDHLFTGEGSVSVGSRLVRLLPVGPAHTDGDVVVVVDDAAVVFAGDILFIGDHPVMWSGPIEGWITACDTILDTGATMVVPGHGPVTNLAGVRVFRDYLVYVAEYARAQLAAGVPHDVAAANMPLDCFAGWGHPERLVLTIGTIYRSLGQDPGTREQLITQMAQRWRDVQ